MISRVKVLIFLLCVTGTCVFWRGDISSYFLPRDERPCACDRCLSEDEPLFMQRFSKFDEPFYSINHNLSEDNFNWWKRIQSRNPTFSAYKKAVKEMFQMIPISAEVEASSPDRCRTCAVVGNSVNLKKSHYGPLVDFQDVVIRLLPIHRRHTSKMISKGRVFIFLLCVTGSCVFWRGDISSYFPPRHKRPCSCDRCLNNGSLFMQRFCKFAEPFLSVNYNLSENNFTWWKHLQDNRQRFSAYKETVKKMFQMIPISAEVEASSPDRCRTCAVVGNSVNLKKSHFGPLIDFQDVVIRMNQGRTKGYEADVGTRTTHHVMYPESAVDLDNTTRLVLFPFKILDLEWVTKALSTGFSGRSYAPMRSKIKANKDLVMVLNPSLMRYVHEVWLQRKGRYPSTGFMALVLALHICDEVHVFGYGADSDGNWSHYWEELRNKKLKTGGHPGDTEYAMIKELDQHQIITFYRGW